MLKKIKTIKTKIKLKKISSNKFKDKYINELIKMNRKIPNGFYITIGRTCDGCTTTLSTKIYNKLKRIK